MLFLESMLFLRSTTPNFLPAELVKLIGIDVSVSEIIATNSDFSSTGGDEVYGILAETSSYIDLQSSKLSASGGVSETVGLQIVEGEAIVNNSTIESRQGGDNLGIYADQFGCLVENG